MALMKDPKPVTYSGEMKVWQCINDKLPDDIVCYFNREVRTREFDFCLLAKNIGFIIIEVKGWNRGHIKKAVSSDEIVMADGRVEDSPKKQARSYAISLYNIMKEEHNIDPLVMDMVCYPFLSGADYNELGLSQVSEPESTLLSEDIENESAFKEKILGIYNKFRGRNFDNMTGEVYDIARRHFEPFYTVKTHAESGTPYSCLSVYPSGMSADDIDDAVTSYFQGTKQIIFTGSPSDPDALAKRLSAAFAERHIMIKNGSLAIDPSDEKFDINVKGGRMSIFNFEAVFIENDMELASFKAYNGRLSEEQEKILKSIACAVGFNIDQFNIEHAQVGRDIDVKAGAGTGKTYSMVSRIAFLCDRASNSDVLDPAEEIAMLTFTRDAAANMKSRLKQLFLNYFLLTGKTKYLEMVTSAEKMRISTIHSFAKDIISNTAAAIGAGADVSVVSGKYDKQRIFDRFFNEYLAKENKSAPFFFKDTPIKINDLRRLMIDIASELYERGCDIRSTDMSAWGTPPPEMPYLNKFLEKVVIAAEKEYSETLLKNNSIASSEYMIDLKRCVESDAFNSNLYRFKYVFIDEFQDTDDVQIAAFISMQRKLHFNFFIVGDLKQSIYRFRGATMTAFEKMGCDNGNWLFFPLTVNYRSDKRLLRRFDNTFAYMGGKGLLTYKKETDTLTGVRVNGINDDLLIEAVPYDKKNTDGFYESLFDVVEKQKRRIEDEMKTGELSENERTIAILTRSNSQINTILKTVKKRNEEKGPIVIESVDDRDLFSLPPGIDLCKLTSAFCHPYDPAYLCDLIRSRNVYMKVDLGSLIGKNSEEKTAYLIGCLDKYYTSVMKKTWEELVFDIQNEPVLKTLRQIYDASTPWAAYSFYDIHKQEYYRANYDLIFEELSNMARNKYLTIDSVNKFLRVNLISSGSLKKARDIDPGSCPSEVKVVCLTAHRAKGLEYGTVIIPYTEKEGGSQRARLDVSYADGKIGYRISYKNNSFSNSYFQSRIEEEENKMDEARVLYVAMTRAIDNFIWFKKSKPDADDEYWGDMLKEL